MSFARKVLAVVGPLAALFMWATIASAFQTAVEHKDDPNHCDPLFIPIKVDELGSAGIFPPDEGIDHTFTQNGPTVCLPFDDPDMFNPTVTIFNASTQKFNELWYVADPETRISNWDGVAEDFAIASSGVAFDNPAFRIDADYSDPGGVHHPLLSESITANGIFEIGEAWEFVLQDYGNTLGLPPDAFYSPGVGAASDMVVTTSPTPLSSGSIIAIPVPEPAGLLMLSLAIVPGLGIVRRVKK